MSERKESPISCVTISPADDRTADVARLIDPRGFAATPIVLPKGVGRSSMEMFAPGTGELLCKGSHDFRGDHARGMNLVFDRVEMELNEPTVMVQTLSSGQVLHEHLRSNRKIAFGDDADYICLAEGLDFRRYLGRSPSIRSTWLSISVSQLETLLGERMSYRLLERLNLEKGGHSLVENRPSRVASALRLTHSAMLSPDIRALYGQSKVLEYFSLLADFVLDRNSVAPTHNGAKFKRLREELEADAGKPPTLSELARRYGMSAKSLNNGFKQLYGETIGAFVMNRRFDAVHSALQESDTPIKVLAAFAGFSYVNNFTAAFRNRFGYTPASLRR